jgi:hypothetical protein
LFYMPDLLSLLSPICRPSFKATSFHGRTPLRLRSENSLKAQRGAERALVIDRPLPACNHSNPGSDPSERAIPQNAPAKGCGPPTPLLYMLDLLPFMPAIRRVTSMTGRLVPLSLCSGQAKRSLS